MSFLMNPWPWYITGPLLGLSVPLLLWTTGKSLGVSSNFRTLCSIALPNNSIAYLKAHPWKENLWNLVFALGLLLGAFIVRYFLTAMPTPLLPEHYHSFSGGFKLLIGGFLVGFGTRYAEGCTSGHSIMGLSNLQKVSLYATLSFFAGGLSAAGISVLLGKL